MPLVEREELAWGGSHSGWDQLCKLFMGRRGRGWVWQLRQLLPPAPTRCAPGRDTPCAVAAGQGHRIVKTARSHWQAGRLGDFHYHWHSQPKPKSKSSRPAAMRPTRDAAGVSGAAHPHTRRLPNVNVGGACPPHGSCKSDFTSRWFCFKRQYPLFPCAD